MMRNPLEALEVSGRNCGLNVVLVDTFLVEIVEVLVDTLELVMGEVIVDFVNLIMGL